MPSARALRIGIALVWVVLAVAYILRNAFVATYAETDVARAERVWPSHPSVRIAQAMLHVADAASRGQGLDLATRETVIDVARLEPLAPEPFLIVGAEAQRNGDLRQAESLLLNARQRNPRAPAPHFLLAEQYISQGRIREGVPEAAVLGRLVPGSLEPLSRAFARYIEASGVPAGMGDVMRSNPDLSGRILSELSTKAANADLLLKIAALAPPSTGPAPGWQTRMINELVAAGDYAKARQVWAKFGGREASPAETIHDPRFEGSNAPPPFNWTVATQGAVIEPKNGGLHVLYFGRDDGPLASQMLVLRPGRYRLRMAVSGQVSDPEGLRWKIACVPDKSLILDQPLGAGNLDVPVAVPSSCGAQQLELSARADESGQSSDFTISGLSLTSADAQ